MSKHTLRLILLVFAAAFVAGFWAGCAVELDANVDETYYCDSDSDCLGPQFICDTAQNVCKKRTGQVDRPCVDEDGDGYGVGDDRSGCRFPEFPDCDDTDPNVHPGAVEVCDGIDNNCDGQIDVMPCERASDCPNNQKDSQGNDISYECNAGHCEAFPVIQICFAPADPCPECGNVLECRNGVLDVVPPACR